ncbi:hypothetical protein [Pandoraea oxalativorans]|nr:hypothetical protein [Pandoraea oxalativorans]
MFLAKIELENRTDAEVAKQMETLYFAPPAGHVPIALTVGEEAWDTVAGNDPKFQSDPGGALLRQMIAKIQDALMTRNREPADIAYLKARDIARHLGNEAFLKANHVLATHNGPHNERRQAINVSIDGNKVRIHTTTTFKEPRTEVVDVTKEFTSTDSGLELRVIHAAVRVAAPSEPSEPLGNSSVEDMRKRFGMPTPHGSPLTATTLRSIDCAVW